MSVVQIRIFMTTITLNSKGQVLIKVFVVFFQPYRFNADEDDSNKGHVDCPLVKKSILFFSM